MNLITRIAQRHNTEFPTEQQARNEFFKIELKESQQEDYNFMNSYYTLKRVQMPQMTAKQRREERIRELEEELKDLRAISEREEQEEQEGQRQDKSQMFLLAKPNSEEAAAEINKSSHRSSRNRKGERVKQKNCH